MILIIDNSNNMIFYEKVINYLMNTYRQKVIFLTFSKNKKSYLDSKNIKSIYLKDVISNKINIENEIEKMETSIENFVFNQCFQNDRILKKFIYKKSKNILLDYGAKFFQLLNDFEIKVVFGEISWGVEYLFYNICKSKNIDYIDPLNVYASNDLRLTFFDYKHSNHYMNLITKNSDSINIKKIIDERKNNDINEKLGKKLRNLKNQTLVNKFKFLMKYRDNYDYRYHYSLKIDKIKIKISKILIKKLSSIVYNTEFNINKEQYYYMPLHIQPEATPDIVSLYYNDQIYLIKQISKSLPIGTKLVVKEHPNGIGSRSFFELININKIGNTLVINHEVSSSELIKNSLAVITVAGTAAIEARYFNKPVLIFSDIYFKDKLTHIYQCYNFNELPKILKKFKNETNFTETKLDSFIKWIYASSYNCYIYDPFIDLNILKKQNIEQFSKAIYEYSQK